MKYLEETQSRVGFCCICEIYGRERHRVLTKYSQKFACAVYIFISSQEFTMGRSIAKILPCTHQAFNIIIHVHKGKDS